MSIHELDTAIMGDLATWVTAFGTLGAFLVGFLQIRKERHLRRRREAQEDIKRERAQAEQVSAWVVKHPQTNTAKVFVSNQSGHPVHKMILSVVDLHGGKNADGRKEPENHRAKIGTIPPGVSSVELVLDMQSKKYHPAVEFAFTDQHGKNWMKRCSARIQEIDTVAAEYYGLKEPFMWQVAKHESVFNRPVHVK